MVKFQEFTNGFVEFKVVRAYPTTKKVQEEHGIMANFSAKTVVSVGKGKERIEREVMAHNSLTISLDSEGMPYIGSRSEQPTKQAEDGSVRNLPRIYYFSLFPGSQRTERTQKEHDTFMEALVKEVEEFILSSQKRITEGSDQPQYRPREGSAASRLAKLQPLKAPEEPKGKSGVDSVI